MTWSILVRDGHGRFGVAIASRFFAVGALCVHTRRGVGAVATQALMNPLYGPAGLAALARGQAPADVVAALTNADAGRDHRQLHMLPASGAAAAHTGSACIDWCGHRQGTAPGNGPAHMAGDGEAFSVAGNMLAGPQVLDATADAWLASTGQPLADRLLAALAAGEAAGGDKRGKQAAALRIHADEDHPALDLRVDDHADPITELHRLHQVSLQRFQPFTACLAGRHDPVGLTDRAAIEACIQAFHAAGKRTR
ncbi:MAG: DUF1028 domain-containing protein [Aquabacterium sp.]|nr:DUF1028 domain-containing protein [Aquabacterium sp.]